MTSEMTYSLAPFGRGSKYTATGLSIIHDLHKMSTQTKQRIEFVALLLGLLLTVSSAVKVFVFLPPRVDMLERSMVEQGVEIKAIQAKSSATDIAIARIEPQLAAIAQSIAEIKSDVRELRNGER